MREFVCDDPSSLIGPLQSVAEAVWPKLRRLQSERQAAQMPIVANTDLFDEILNETYDRLRHGIVDDVWWMDLLRRVEHQIVAPNFLRRQAIQEWLAQPEVERDFKALARSRIMGGTEDEDSSKSRLRGAYEKTTGERGSFVDSAIDVVTAVLSAGYLASIVSSQRPVVGVIQEVAAENRAGIAHLDNRFNGLSETIGRFGPDHYVREDHTERARRELDKIRKRRSVDPDRACREIEALSQKVSDGDLRYAEERIKANVIYWAARLHAGRAETLSKAKTYREKQRQTDSSLDTRVIDALIAESEGDNVAALRIIRDVDDADGRSCLFAMLRRIHGDNDALAWFDENPNCQDTDLLTGAGWSHVAVCLAGARRWEEAVSRLGAAHGCCDDWPDLSFLEGVLNAAMLLPEEYRPYALDMNIFHPSLRVGESSSTDRYRGRAQDCFVEAAQLMDGLDLGGRAQAAKDWLLWLRLSDPNGATVEAARQEIQEGMKDGRRAVDLIPFATRFDITFDQTVIQRHLAQRDRMGGLTAQENGARVMLARHTMVPGEFARFLEQEETSLSEAIPNSVLTGMRIEALVNDGQVARARLLLEERSVDLVEGDRERFLALIDIHEGSDPRTQLEKLYQRTKSLIDLKNLVDHLIQKEDWRGLRPLLEELFRREQTVENATKVVGCLRRDTSASNDHVLDFLSRHDDLVERSQDLASAKAWALFHAGRWSDAKSINDILLRDRNGTDDLLLDINLALQTGNWERFPAIIEREWPNRSCRDPHTLMYLASLAAEADATAERAVELATLAAKKAPDDPKILLGAFTLTFQLGREDAADPAWISRAAEMSTEEGPVWRFDFRKIVKEVLPKQREHSQFVQRSLLRGEIPLHMATGALGVSLSHYLLDISRRNSGCQDGRQRILIPIISGGRQSVDIDPDWSVGFDVTSVMVLAHLGLLREAIASFERVVLAPETLVLLLNERRRARFHQPSQVEDAEKLRQLVDGSSLKVMESLPDPPSWLITEVGSDMASLLEIARTGGGFVVRPHPIHKLSTFMEEEAELAEYAELIVSSNDFARLLYEAGHVDAETYNHAKKYLQARDREEGVHTSSTVLSGPVYLDDLAVTYLLSAGILEAASNVGIDLRVHPCVKRELGAITTASRAGFRLTTELNEIRTELRDALESRKAVFLRQHNHDDGERGVQSSFQSTPTLTEFLWDSAPCDAMCFDDRFVNKHSVLTDRAGRTVKVICALDVLRHLEKKGAQSPGESLAAVHRLRAGGFVLVPVEAREIERRLRDAHFEQPDSLIENVELRTLRQTLMRVSSVDLLQLPQEASYLGATSSSCVLLIRRFWEDSELPPERAAAFSDWLWRNIALPIITQAGASQSSVGLRDVEEAFCWITTILLQPLHLRGDRYEAFRSWVEQSVFENLRPANSKLIDAVAMRVRSQMEQLIEQVAKDEPGANR